MNIFILSLIQKEIVEFMMDKHISKILLESVQMLCSARRLLEPEPEQEYINSKLYRMAHKNHPVTIWCRTSMENFIWTLDLVDCLHDEWKFRYEHDNNKVHKSYEMAIYLREHMPTNKNFIYKGLTPFALAMPDKYKCSDPVKSYRDYYMSPEKQKIATWNKKRNKPDWYNIIVK